MSDNVQWFLVVANILLPIFVFLHWIISLILPGKSQTILARKWGWSFTLAIGVALIFAFIVSIAETAGGVSGAGGAGGRGGSGNLIDFQVVLTSIGVWCLIPVSVLLFHHFLGKKKSAHTANPNDEQEKSLKAPGYIWNCQICGQSNSAQAASCMDCAFPCHASGAEIAEAKKRFIEKGYDKL